MRVLVTYASKHGATAGIAGKIGEVLCRAGLPTDVLPVERVRDVTPYGAVVLGSAVYIGMWRRAAAAFLKANEQKLSGKLVWIFSSGPTEAGEPEAFLGDTPLPKSLLPIADRIRPRAIAIFHGAVNRPDLNLFERWIINKVHSPVGDFRNWDAIAAWAAKIADAIKKGAAETECEARA